MSFLLGDFGMCSIRRSGCRTLLFLTTLPNLVFVRDSKQSLGLLPLGKVEGKASTLDVKTKIKKSANIKRTKIRARFLS
jgi:hypothetical protein